MNVIFSLIVLLQIDARTTQRPNVYLALSAMQCLGKFKEDQTGFFMENFATVRSRKSSPLFKIVSACNVIIV